MENIRVESFLGNDKVIVGNKYTDLVLETLGKVYIKTGNNSRVLSDVLKLLDQVQESEIKSQTIIVGSLLEMEQMEYPGDGFFIYNTLTSTLYISYDERYIALIEAAEGADDGYVRRKGDTMTGQLEINTVGPPLIVASSKLVSNLNAEFINGYSSDDLAKKNVDEYIYGNWTFKGKGVSEDTWVFKDNVRMYGDLVTSRSLTSPDFMSGFGGYGWRLDANTNTLTVDYLVVRKAMRVYELVINKISATNGSIWVTNSSKCSKAVQPTILTDAQLRSIGTWTGSSANIDAMLKLLSTDGYYIPLPGNGANTLSIVTRTKEISKADSINTTPKTFVNYKFIIHVKDPRGLVNNTLFRGPQTLYDESLLTSTSSDQNHIAFRKCITLYYISMGMTVTKWGGNEGQWDEGTIPLEWTLTETFNKDTAFYMIPKGDKVATEDFEKNGFNSTYLTPIQPFYKYFGLDTTIVNQAITESNSQFNSSMNTTVVMPNLWVVNTDDEEYPLFKPGDIIRCQKYTGGNIKYYDAIVMSQMESRQFIVQKATSVFDIYTEIHYNEDGSVASSEESYNNTQYSKTETSYDVNTGARKQVSSSNTTSDRLDDISEGDDMIQMGNIFNTERQGALYLTSSDDGGPYMDVITELNRPDYSVLYDVPLYDRKELIYKSTKHNYYYQESPSIEGAPTFTVDIKDGESVITKTYYCTEYPTQTSVIKMRDNKYRHSLTKTTKVRIGRLDGIYNEMFGKKQPYGYGLYGENVFLTGEFYLNNGQSIVDFSEENILLKFKNAGLEIKETLNDKGEKIPVLDENGEPVLDKDGNPVYETSISMNADKFYFYIGDKLAMTLGKMFDKTTGKLDNVLLDINGWVKVNGLEIWGQRSEWKPDGSRELVPDTYQLNAKIDQNGDIYGQDAYLYNAYMKNAYVQGTIVADSGRIGSIHIEPVSYSLYHDATHILWQKLENHMWGSAYERSGFKLGVGKRELFDSNPAFLEIFNYANAFTYKDNRYGIKVAGHMNAALWAAVTEGIDPPTRRPNDDLMIAGFFDGDVYCTQSVNLGNMIFTKCPDGYRQGNWPFSQARQDQYGSIIDNQGNGVVLNPAPGTLTPGLVYSGCTFDGKDVDFDHASITVVNGLVVGLSRHS
jgi:hypothetical protein|nr:MAG TPA: tail protein [Caudoviricetes sp.]